MMDVAYVTPKWILVHGFGDIVRRSNAPSDRFKIGFAE